MSEAPNITRDFPDCLTDEALHEAYELEIQSQNGDPIRFGELVAGKGDSITTIVIFGELPHPRLPVLISTTHTHVRIAKQTNNLQSATSSAPTTKSTSAS